MSASKAGVSLRSLALTPDRIPHFLIPSPASRHLCPLLSPCARRDSPDRTRLLSDNSADGSPDTRPSPTHPASSQFLRLSTPVPTIRIRCHRSGTSEAEADTDLSTRAAMSLSHVGKVTTPYGFHAVLAASPCTHRRESLFHRNKPVTVKDTNSTDQSDPDDPTQHWGLAGSSDPGDPATAPPPGASRMCLRPIKALGLQMMRELKKPVAVLKVLSPARRRAKNYRGTIGEN